MFEATLSVVRIENGMVVNTSAKPLDYVLATDGSEMLLADATAQGIPWAQPPTAAQPPLLTATMRSFRLACGRSLWTNIEAVVDGIADADAKWEAQQYIQTSPTVARNHPLVIQLAAALELSDAQADAVFEAAAVLDASA